MCRHFYFLNSKLNIIFLDIDGVLIKFASPKKVDHSEFEELKYWDKEALQLVNKLIKSSGAKVVITSSYRNHKTKKQIVDMMQLAGFNYNIYDVIPSIKYLGRGGNINKWLKEHNVSNFVIIDDQYHNIEEYFPKNFVKVETNEGLTLAHTLKALKILQS